MKRKTILQITTTYNASPGSIMANLQKLGEANGFEMIGAVGRGNLNNELKNIKIGNKFEVLHHVLKTRLFGLHGFGSKLGTKKFIKQIDKMNPDIIHLHNIHGYYINIELLFNYFKKTRVPIVWTFHDCWPFTGHCSYFDYIGCNKWEKGCYKCPIRFEYPKSYIDSSKKNYKMKKSLFTGVSNLTIVTPSEWLSNLVKLSYLKEHNVKVINNGIDLNKFRETKSNFRNEHNIGNKYIILGVASVWSNRKGLNFFIELANNLHSDEIIVLVGLSAKQKKSIHKQIIGISRTSSIEELAAIYSAANVFVNPTLEDNFPTVNLESLACGTPVVTFNTGGSPESIVNDCGIVTKGKTVQDLRTAIDSIKLGDEEAYKKNAIKRAEENYDSERNYMEYIHLYKELL